MKRREFLGKSIIGTAGITVAGSVLLHSCKNANDRIVLALIGCGARGLSSIIDCCKENANVVIGTACDVDDLRTAAAASEIEKQLGYKPRVTRYMQDVFGDDEVDAVWIATPDHWHALATILACQAGKDVYVEKTPCLCIKEGRKMIEAARKHRRIVQAGYQNRSGAYISAARDYIRDGKLGQVVHIRVYNLLQGVKWTAVPDEEAPDTIDWDAWIGPAPYNPYNPGRKDGWINYYDYNPGTLNDASHQFDICRMVMGDPGHPDSVYAWGGNKVWHSEKNTPELQSIIFDYGKYTMTCESGSVTSYMSKTPNDIRMDPTRFPDWRTNADRIEIYGTEGLMFLGRTGGGWQVFGPKEQMIERSGGIHPDREHQANFIECLRSRKQPNSDMQQAHLSASLVHFANIATRIGNKQLIIDKTEETFIGNDEANKLLDTTYRGKYKIPEKV